MNHTQYTQYFRHLATTHVAIRHDLAQAKDCKAFMRISLSEDPLQRELDLEEFLVNISMQSSFPLLVLVSYLSFNRNNNADDRTKIKMGSFYVLDQAPKDDFEIQELKITSCEEIADDLVGHLIHQFEQVLQPGSHILDENSIATEPINGAYKSQLFGVKTTFEWTERANAALKFKPEKFIV